MKKHPVYLIGNAHLDPVWLWRWNEGMSEVVQTFRAAVAMLEEYEDIIFTCSSACYYEWLESNDPETFEKVKKYVIAGRIVPVNGWLVQPDCNHPSLESFARHSLYSQRYYLEKFGITCKTGYNVDSFGHNAMLPQILKNSGMEQYVMMRPDKNENPDMPDNAFIWRSSDGSEIECFRINGTYAVTGKEWLDKSLPTVATSQMPVMIFYGVGNHGGGPTRYDIEYIKNYAKENPDQPFVFSSTDAYFDALRKSGAELTVWDKEMHHHASGCYCATARIKQLNRKCESLLYEAELWDTLASRIFGTKPHTSELKDAWKVTLFNQFHDILGGCSIKEAYDDAFAAAGYSITLAERIKSSALIRIASSVNTSLASIGAPVNSDDCATLRFLSIPIGQPRPVIVFNSLPFEVTRTVTVNGVAEKITDDEGNELDIQLVKSSALNATHANTVFSATVPSLGYRLFWASCSSNGVLNGALALSAFDSCEYILENDYIKAEFSHKTGYLTSLFDKISNTELLNGESAVPTVIDISDSDTWAHGIFKFDRRIADMKFIGAQKTADGFVTRAIRFEYRYNTSTLYAEYCLDKDSRMIRVNCKTIWSEPLTALKLRFKTAGNNGKCIAGIQGGEVSRECDGKEEPFLGHIGVNTEINGKSCAFTLISDSRTSYDCSDNELRLTLLRNSIYADHFSPRPFPESSYDYTDEGVQEFTFAILAHSADDRTIVARHSAILHHPAYVAEEGYHSGSLAKENSFIKLDAENVSLQALKAAEDGAGHIVRLCETSGKECKAHIVCSPIGLDTYIEFKPYKSITLKIENGNVTYVNYMEL